MNNIILNTDSYKVSMWTVSSWHNGCVQLH